MSRGCFDRLRTVFEPEHLNHFPVLTTLLQPESIMGRGILLWLIGVPIPIIILLALFVR